MHSARGRWFLEEFARRSRKADTQRVLDAITCIESVICGERGRDAVQNLRIDLLEMARTIARTRTEVAEIKPRAAPQGKAAEPGADASAAPAPLDIFAAAERLQDVAWEMRERGIDPATCDQIETLAGTILSASALRDPNDHRVRKLADVLHYLERRIDAMVAGVAGARDAQAPSEPPPAAAALDGEAARHMENRPGHAAVDPLAAPDIALATSPVVSEQGAMHEPASAPGSEPAALDVAPSVERVDIDLDPLAVVPAREPMAHAAEPPGAELEHAPIVVESPFEEPLVAMPVVEPPIPPEDVAATSAGDPPPQTLELAPLLPAQVERRELENENEARSELKLHPLMVEPPPALGEDAAALGNSQARPETDTPTGVEARDWADAMLEVEAELFASDAERMVEADPSAAVAQQSPEAPQPIPELLQAPRPAPSDLLATLKAMSDEERIALFT
jgi:hypothetical protein